MVMLGARSGLGWAMVLTVVMGCSGNGSPAASGGEHETESDGHDATDAGSGPSTTSSTGAVDTSTTSEGSGDATSSTTTADTDPSGSTTTDPTGPTPDDCITDVGSGHHVFECDGLSYDVEVPEACLEAGCGMIFDIHGLTMDAQMEEANSGLRALGLANGYIVVQPNAEVGPIGRSWNPTADDPRVFDFMQRVAAAWNVDAKRWHFTGFSQGGAMSWRFICAHADVLASAAPAAACGNIGGLGACSFEGDEVPSNPLPILYMHGTTDALVNFSCFGPLRDTIVDHYGLSSEEVLAEDDDYRWTRHESDEMVLELIEHDYEASSFILRGHCFPGSNDDGNAPGQLMSYGCEEPTAITWGEIVMQFFLDHPKP